MAAIFTSDYDSTSPAPLWDDEQTPVVARRPDRARPTHLRVVEGGRSPRSMARVYRRRRAVAVLVSLFVLTFLVLGVGALFGLLDAASGPVRPCCGHPSRSGFRSGPGGAGGRHPVVHRPTTPAVGQHLRAGRPARSDPGPGPLQAGDRLPWVASASPRSAGS